MAPVNGTKTSRGVTFLRPVQDEKREQAQIVNLIEQLGGAVYVLGTRRAQYCGLCGGKTSDQGTRQTPGIGDLFVLLPPSPRPREGASTALVPLWIEVKGKTGSLQPEQVMFRSQCLAAHLGHIVGGLDEVMAWLERGGWVRTTTGMSSPVTPGGASA